ncbi:hypothetical protein FHG87_021063 [Trinorchestia longiramus]|nr:hypothetical protein FHG87_021063 [Trinorchestia longiramus]
MKALHSQHCYFKVFMECSSMLPCPLTPQLLEVCLQTLVTERFGAAEACRDLTIIALDTSEQSFVVRVHESSYARLHCCVALCDALWVAGHKTQIKFIVKEPVVRSLPLLAGTLRTNPLTCR